MPELPEVETVRTGLEKILSDQPLILRIRLARADIRFVIPKNIPNLFKNQKVLGVRRRAKYLLIDTPKAILISHLGMTGSWRLAKKGDDDKHDHVFIELEGDRTLVFRDPRRFGILDFTTSDKESSHPRLKILGPEPLDESHFTAEYLFKISRKRKVASKVFIMDQKIVVGVGNIYASEALFLAKVRPQKLAAKLTLADCEAIVNSIRKILWTAIQSGGSSIRDYRDADGGMGSFQKTFNVYDRESEPCRVCGQKIRAKILGGRNTFWCNRCQK